MPLPQHTPHPSGRLHLLCDQICFAPQSSEKEMRDLDKALADIFAIRSQIAAGTAFRGYGPATVAATGGLALFTALFSFLLLADSSGPPGGFFFRSAPAAPPSRA